MNELISIIIPVYKVEKYLEQCIESVINQSYTNLEIILVDDGSPDNCGAICDAYADKDARIKVIHKENGGLSDARNAGLDIMKGQYVAFVDSDDWLPIEAIERLYKVIIINEADIVVGECERIRENGEIIYKNSNMKEGVFSAIEWMRHILINGCAAWAQLHKKEVFQNCRFPVGEINEDEAIVLKMISKCKQIAVTTDCVYYYRSREDSITTNKFSKKKLAWKEHCADNWKYIRENYSEIEDVAVMRYRKSILWSLTQIALSGESEEYTQEINQMMKEIRDNIKIFTVTTMHEKKELLRLLYIYFLGFNLYKKVINIKKY